MSLLHCQQRVSGAGERGIGAGGGGRGGGGRGGRKRRRGEKEFCALYHVDSETTRLTRLFMHTPEKLRARYCYWSVYESTSSSILTLT